MFRRLMLLALLLAPSLAGAQEPIRVALKPTGRFDGEDSNDRRGRVALALTPPPRCRFPKFTAARPIYMSYGLVDGPRTMVLDRPTTKSPYTRLYADLDGDGDLTNDAPLKGIRRGSGFYYQADFGNVPFRVKVGNRPTTAALNLSLLVLDTPGSEPTSNTLAQTYLAFVESNNWLQGTFMLGANRYMVRLADNNMDGTCDPIDRVEYGSDANAPAVILRGDKLLISDANSSTMHELPFCRRLLIGSKLFGVAFDGEARTLTLAPETTRTLARVDLGQGFRHVALATDRFDDSIAMLNPPAQVPLPAGSWRPLQYMVARPDPSGSQWLISARATAATPFRRIDRDGATSLALAESFTPRAVFTRTPADPDMASRPARQRYALFEYALIGNNAEIVQMRYYLPARRGFFETIAGVSWRQPPNPRYDIVTAEGARVTQGQFEYG